MKVVLIARASLYREGGGDTIQVMNTAKYLESLGMQADVRLTCEPIDYASYDLLHFFNVTRPADMLVHIRRSKKPYVISPVFIEYGEYDRQFRRGIAGRIFRFISSHAVEYLKVIARQVVNGEKIMSREYVWMGQKKSMREVLDKASFLLPNSYNEYKRLQKEFDIHRDFRVIPNGIDPALFSPEPVSCSRDELLVLCVARIEGIKNQLNLIKALNGSRFRLLLIGKHARNQHSYWEACRKAAGSNVEFMGWLPQGELLHYYRLAKVHILPSWFETTGLSSLEAAAMGCNVIITDRGDAKEYFGDDAVYCDPASPRSIYEAVEKAAGRQPDEGLRARVYQQYTWQEAGIQTLKAYTHVLKKR